VGIRNLLRIPDWLRYRGKPPQQPVFRHEHSLDDIGDWVTDGIDYAKIQRLIRAADDGDVAETLQAFEEIESKDPRLYGLLQTRRMGLTGLPWRVVSASESQWFRGDKVLADEAAAMVGEKLDGLEDFPEALEHLATAIGPGLAMIEIVWNGIDVHALQPLPSSRIQADTQNDGQLRVITADEQMGIPLEAAKWIVHAPSARTGFIWTRSLSHALAMAYVTKLLAKADWAMFVERFGIPFIHATTDGDVSSAEKAALEDMLGRWGTAGWAHFKKGVEIGLVESASRGISPHEAIVEWCNREMVIAILGGTLTADTTGATGTFAAANVHNQVRADLTADDIRKESRTVGRDLIKPMVLYQFPARRPAMPTFEHYVDELVDQNLLADMLGKAQAAGLRVGRDWAHDALGIPIPQKDEEVLQPPQPQDPFEEGL
jgi:phage gp29-like protein